MGGLVQIKSDTFVAWMGGTPISNWTDLKISTAEPQQSSEIYPMLNDSGFCEWSKGLDIKFPKEKGDLFSSQCKLFCHFQDMEMDTIMYLMDLGYHTKMVNHILDPTQFTQTYIKTATKEQCKLYSSYNHLKDHSTCYALLDGLDVSFKKYIEDLILTTSASQLPGCRS